MKRFCSQWLWVSFALLITSTVAAAATVDIGSQRELMVDDYLIERFVGGAELEMHRPTPREVVLTHENPWEGSGCGYYTILQDTDRLRMYYTCQQQPVTGTEIVPTHPLYTGYAESVDGIHWTKPNLGLFEYNGSTANNIVWAGNGAHDLDPFLDPNPNCAPEAKYKAVTFGQQENALIAFQSADGIHWSRLGSQPIITDGAFDSQNLAFWDATRGEYRAYFRDFRDGRRDIKTATSQDFIHWTDPVWLDYPGAPAEQLYTNQIEPYYRSPRLFIGFPTRYTERGWSPSMEELPDNDARHLRSDLSPRYGTAITDGLFMTSRDGVTFDRWGEAFIPPGIERPGNWNYGDGYQSWRIIETKSDVPGAPNELSMYAGENQWFDNCQLRRYTLRIDGFVSVNAPRSGGEIVTKPFMFTGNELQLNFATSAAGSVYVELQDANGSPIPGYSLADSDEVFGDTLSRAVTWKGNSNVGGLAGTPVRLRFAMSDADLYSFIFTNGGKPERPGPVAGGPVIAGGTTPYAWYRADVGVDTYPDDETRVAWWEDRSGNSRHLEATGKPLVTTNGVDGRQVVTFGGADAFVSTKAEWGEAAPGTIFAVWRQSADSGTGVAYVYDAEADEQRELLSIMTTDEGSFAEIGGSVYTPPSSWVNHYTAAPALAAPDPDTWVVSSASHTTGTTDTIRFNGEEVYSGDLLSGGMSGLRIGRFVLDRNYWNGDICELIVFEGELSATEREAIEQALMDRWGIIATPPPLLGDANLSGRVDDADAAILAAHWHAIGVGWAQGDFNDDGTVDDKDASILGANWLATAAAEGASVPEPTSLALLLGGLLSLLAVRRRSV